MSTPTNTSQNQIAAGRPGGQKAGLLKVAWIVALCLLCATRFIHLRADFPDQQKWRDWATYTDEGWYGNAAVVHSMRAYAVTQSIPASWRAPAGTPGWYLAGDFNPAVALPVWPLLLSFLFHFTGLSLLSARCLVVMVSGTDCYLLYLLLRKSAGSQWPPLLAVTLALSNAYLFAFSRLALLEPLECGFLLLALLFAQPSPLIKSRQRFRLLATAFACCLLLLTKTTGLFLLPGVFYLLFTTEERKIRWFEPLFVCATLFLVYGVYVLLIRHVGFAEDFQYLFTANHYPPPAGSREWAIDAFYTARGLFWIGRILPLLAILGTTACVFLRHNAEKSLFKAAWISTLSYGGFLCWHNNPQPHYYLPLAYLSLILVALPLDAMFSRSRFAGGMVTAFLLLAIASGCLRIAGFLLHPRYTFISAAGSLTRYIDQHPHGNRILLASSGAEITLITGLPAICDDYGTDDLPIRIARYQPGWFAAWDDVDPDILHDLHTRYWLERVAAYPAMNDPDRNLLVLYKLHPQPGRDVGVTVEE